MTTLDKELEIQEMETIKEQLDMLGVKYHHNANLTTLKKLKAEAIEPKEEVAVKEVTETTDRSTQMQAANEMVRVAITCRNPAKAQRRGEFFTCGNGLIGNIKAFIPYNCEASEDVRIPRIFIDMLRSRQYQHTVELSDSERVGSPVMHKTMWLKEFAVVELGDK